MMLDLVSLVADRSLAIVIAVSVVLAVGAAAVSGAAAPIDRQRAAEWCVAVAVIVSVALLIPLPGPVGAWQPQVEPLPASVGTSPPSVWPWVAGAGLLGSLGMLLHVGLSWWLIAGLKRRACSAPRRTPRDHRCARASEARARHSRGR